LFWNGKGTLLVRTMQIKMISKVIIDSTSKVIKKSGRMVERKRFSRSVV